MTETDKERIDRELIELLNELRVVLPGVQVLSGFLLLLPFQQSFVELGALERTVYYVAFVASAVASVLLIAPSTYHRVRFREPDKERLLRVANRLLLGGTLALGIALAAAVFLITDLLMGAAAGAIAAAVAAAFVVGFWYLLPLLDKADSEATERRSR